MHKITQTLLDKFTIDYLRNQVLKNAYGNDDTIIAGLDPRTLLCWYLFFGLIPWFLNDFIVLLGMFVFVAITTKLAKIAPLVLFLFVILPAEPYDFPVIPPTPVSPFTFPIL